MNSFAFTVLRRIFADCIKKIVLVISNYMYFIEVLKKGESVSVYHKYHISLVLGMKMDTILLIYRCSF